MFKHAEMVGYNVGTGQQIEGVQYHPGAMAAHQQVESAMPHQQAVAAYYYGQPYYNQRM